MGRPVFLRVVALLPKVVALQPLWDDPPVTKSLGCASMVVPARDADSHHDQRPSTKETRNVPHAHAHQ